MLLEKIVGYGLDDTLFAEKEHFASKIAGGFNG